MAHLQSGEPRKGGEEENVVAVACAALLVLTQCQNVPAPRLFTDPSFPTHSHTHTLFPPPLLPTLNSKRTYRHHGSCISVNVAQPAFICRLRPVGAGVELLHRGDPLRGAPPGRRRNHHQARVCAAVHHLDGVLLHVVKPGRCQAPVLRLQGVEPFHVHHAAATARKAAG